MRQIADRGPDYNKASNAPASGAATMEAIVRSKIRTLLACVLVGMLAASTAALAQKKGGGQPAPNPRIQVTFSDAAGDRLVSDGGGEFADCEAEPINCAGLGQIWTGGSEDATFRMAADSPRRFHAYCGVMVSGAENCGGTIGQDGFSPDGWFLNVRGIGAMPISATLAREAIFSVDGDQGGRLYESSLPNKRFQWMGVGAQRVAVTRTSSTQWVVTAPIASETAVGENAMLDLQARKGYTSVGTYAMPFSLVIDCLKDCDRLTVP